MHTPLSDRVQLVEDALANLRARAETTELNEVETAMLEILDGLVEVVAELAKHRWTKIV